MYIIFLQPFVATNTCHKILPTDTSIAIFSDQLLGINASHECAGNKYTTYNILKLTLELTVSQCFIKHRKGNVLLLYQT